MNEDEDDGEDYGDDEEMLNEQEVNTCAKQSDEVALQKLKSEVAQERYVISRATLDNVVERLRCTECGAATDSSTITTKDLMGGIYYMYKCTNKHHQTWGSTPMYGGKSVVGQLLTLAILLSGLCYHQVAQAARFIGLQLPSPSSFFRLQKMYEKTITKFFNISISNARASAPAEVVAVDTRYDSPGFCASKSTTIFMNMNDAKIIHATFGDHRMTNRSSPNMEEMNFRSGMDTLLQLDVQEIVTDASSTVKSVLEEPKYDHVRHSMDLWHKGKRIAELMLNTIKTNENIGVLRQWIKPIVNHFWWAAKTCHGDSQVLQRKWMGLLWHVQDIHHWTIGACEHSQGQIMQQPTLSGQTPAFKALRGISAMVWKSGTSCST